MVRWPVRGPYDLLYFFYFYVFHRSGNCLSWSTALWEISLLHVTLKNSYASVTVIVVLLVGSIIYKSVSTAGYLIAPFYVDTD